MCRDPTRYLPRQGITVLVPAKQGYEKYVAHLAAVDWRQVSAGGAGQDSGDEPRKRAASHGQSFNVLYR